MSTSSVPRLFSFIAGTAGPWRIARVTAISGESLAGAERLAVVSGEDEALAGAWALRGITSNERYVERAEKTALLALQPGLGRPAASHAALIPIRKTAAWWALSQDERRQIFEARSRHIELGLAYLPAIARRLHHCRDLDPGAPFDFLTWFEYAPADEGAFDALLAALRASPEWVYVDREVDIRLQRLDG
jgi:hypothetical protein